MTTAAASPHRPIAPLTAADVARAARALYTEGPALWRHLQHWRPYICPFERLVEHVPPGASVLDVGCGGGLFLALLAHYGRLGHGVGIDIAARPIELARRVAARRSDARLDFRVLGPGEPWPTGPFDVVSMIDVMHHLPRAAQPPALADAAGRIRPGGRLLYKDMAQRPAWMAAANRLHDLVMARQWIHYVPVEDVERWASRAGLRLEHAERIDRLCYAHELRVFTCPDEGDSHSRTASSNA